MNKSCIFNEDTFYEYFKPFRHTDARYDIWGGHGLETFGEDFELVRRQDPAFVWTVVDGDFGSNQWIVSGAHHVNRVCYLLTEVPHNSAPLEFRVQSGPRSLTPLGLKREISRLKRLLSLNE